jgi:hypothetical protein
VLSFSNSCKKPGSLWQETPQHLLHYSVDAMHRFGHLPNIFTKDGRYSLKAKVFSDIWLHFQCAVLIGWTLLLHYNILNLSETAQRQLVKVFGTAWMGAIFNLATIVTFILGLFITLVVQRWFELRATYSQLRSNTLDLAILFINYIKADQPKESAAKGTQPKGPTPPAKDEAKDRATLLQLIRYLKLAHVLFLNAATQHQETYRSPDSRLVKVWRNVVERARRFFIRFKRVASEAPSIVGASDTEEEAAVAAAKANADKLWGEMHLNNKFGLKLLQNLKLINESEFAELEAAKVMENWKGGGMAVATIHYWISQLVCHCTSEGMIINPAVMPHMIARMSGKDMCFQV